MSKIFHILFVLISFNSFGCVYQDVPLKNQFKSAILTNDNDLESKIAHELKSSYSKTVLNYYRTQLTLIHNHSILITNGLEDTYPLIILQKTESISPKTTIVSLELLNDTEYLKKTFNQLKLSIDFDKTSKSIYLSRLLNANKEVYVSTTINSSNYSQHKNNLYLEGLSLKLNSTNQVDVLNSFWQRIQKQNISELKLSGHEQKLLSNYLPPLLTLYKINVLNGTKDKTLKNAILVLSNLLNKKETVIQILKQYDKGG